MSHNAILMTDLYGLLLFLGVDPYWVKQWWTRLLYEPYCHGQEDPMIDLVSKVMWRTAKHNVLDQVGNMACLCHLFKDTGRRQLRVGDIQVSKR